MHQQQSSTVPAVAGVCKANYIEMVSFALQARMSADEQVNVFFIRMM